MFALIADTSCNTCSVAIAHNDSLVCCKESNVKFSHSEILLDLIDKCIKESQLSIDYIDIFGIVSGPGSYTGLRIGAASILALCQAKNAKLIEVSSFDVMIARMKKKLYPHEESYLLCPSIDARRNEIYCTIRDINNNIILDQNNVILDENSFNNILSNRKILFFGNCNNKISSIIKHQNALFYNDQEVYPCAEYAIGPVYDKFVNHSLTKISDFRINYIKPFFFNK